MNTKTREVIDYVRRRRNNGTSPDKVIAGLRLKFPTADRLDAARTLLSTDIPKDAASDVATLIVNLMYRDTPFDNPPVHEGEHDWRMSL